jgi:hypothetical protein
MGSLGGKGKRDPTSGPALHDSLHPLIYTFRTTTPFKALAGIDRNRR